MSSAIKSVISFLKREQPKLEEELPEIKGNSDQGLLDYFFGIENSKTTVDGIIAGEVSIERSKNKT